MQHGSSVLGACFEPTYEELKLSDGRLDDAGTACFEPTYEELKLSNERQLCTTTPCFEPTYEELKPESVLYKMFIK